LRFLQLDCCPPLSAVSAGGCRRSSRQVTHAVI
jgi:hypothetical protein